MLLFDSDGRYHRRGVNYSEISVLTLDTFYFNLEEKHTAM